MLSDLMRLAFADAFDLGRVQRIDLAPSLMLALLAHPAGEHERMSEDARNQADRRRLLANAITCRSALTPQKSGDSRFFTDDRIVTFNSIGVDFHTSFAIGVINLVAIMYCLVGRRMRFASDWRGQSG